jgi:hypothetical protein
MGQYDIRIFRHLWKLSIASVAVGLVNCAPSASTRDASAQDASALDSASDAVAKPAACALGMTACDPARCQPILGTELVPSKACRVKVVLGCRDFGPSSTDGLCFRNLSDGRLVNVPGTDLAASADWAPCSADEATRVQTAICEP